jgi:hypothetical protein
MAIKMGTPKPLDVGVSIQNASYDGVSFDPSSQDSAVYDVQFNPAGTKMFLLGFNTNNMYQYSLSTAFDIGTAVYDNKSFDLSGQTTNPSSFFINNAGTKMIVAFFTSDIVYGYTLGTAFDISTATADGNSFTIAQDASPGGLHFNPTGTKMFIRGNSTDRIIQYSLGTAFDVSSATYNSISFDVSSQMLTPTGLYINSTGKKMFVSSRDNDAIYEYDLNSAFDVGSAVYNTISFGIGSQDTSVETVTMNSTGTKMYIAGFTNNRIYQYSL